VHGVAAKAISSGRTRRRAAPAGAPASRIGERLNRWLSFPKIELKAQSMSDFLDAPLVSNRIAG
jgi:hypothetical protein